MPRNRQVIRELQIILTLERARYGLTLHEMAAEYGVSVRTIRRDLEALQAAGLAVVEEAGRRWRVLNWRHEVA